MVKTTVAHKLFDLGNVEMDQFVRDGHSDGNIYEAIVEKYWPLVNPGDRVEMDDPGEFEKSLAGLLFAELSLGVCLNELGLGEMCDYESRMMLGLDESNLPPSSNVLGELRQAMGHFESALDTYMDELKEPVKKTGLDEGEPLRANGRFILLMCMHKLAQSQTQAYEAQGPAVEMSKIMEMLRTTESK